MSTEREAKKWEKKKNIKGAYSVSPHSLVLSLFSPPILPVLRSWVVVVIRPFRSAVKVGSRGENLLLLERNNQYFGGGSLISLAALSLSPEWRGGFVLLPPF
jgi:hypothetical protein